MSEAEVSSDNRLKAYYGPDSGGRMKGVTIVKPIVYGFVYVYLMRNIQITESVHQLNLIFKSLFLEINN